MTHNKKQLATMRRWLKRQSETTAKRAVTTYILEPLEARVLLSADLANAVMPVKPVDAVPQQAVVLTLPAQQLGEQYNQPSSTNTAAAPTPPIASTAGFTDAAQYDTSHGDGSEPMRTVAEILGLSAYSSQQLSSPLTSAPVFVQPTSQDVLPAQDPSQIKTLPDLAPISQASAQPISNAQASTEQDTAHASSPSMAVASPAQNNSTTNFSSQLISVADLLTSGPNALQSTAEQVPSAPATPVSTSIEGSTPIGNGTTVAETSSQITAQVPTQQVQSSSTNQIQVPQSLVSNAVQPTQQASQTNVTVTSSVSPTNSQAASLVSTVATNGAIDPTLPQSTVDTTMPSTTVTVRVGPHGDYTNLQDALNNVSLGTTILLQPGVSYTSPNDNGLV